MGNDNLGQWIKELIEEFIAGPENPKEKWDDEPAWAAPLVGFSSGDDKLYDFYKKDIGEFYVMPNEFMADAHCKEYKREDLTVISWILPQTDATKADHRKEKYFPSERWARSRIYGEQINVKLRKHLVAKLKEKGFDAVGPMISPLWKGARSVRYSFASTWSERHAAYAAGLGTFGLSDALITPKGKAMRTGSVIVDAVIEPTPRTAKHHNENCLFLMDGSCGKCIERCPIGAITAEGHDKALCNKYVTMTRSYVPKHYGFDGYGCGFCQTGVPCESGIPNSRKIAE
mgnify:FL=1